MVPSSCARINDHRREDPTPFSNKCSGACTTAGHVLFNTPARYFIADNSRLVPRETWWSTPFTFLSWSQMHFIHRLIFCRSRGLDRRGYTGCFKYTRKFDTFNLYVFNPNWLVYLYTCIYTRMKKEIKRQNIFLFYIIKKLFFIVFFNIFTIILLIAFIQIVKIWLVKISRIN